MLHTLRRLRLRVADAIGPGALELGSGGGLRSSRCAVGGDAVLRNVSRGEGHGRAGKAMGAVTWRRDVPRIGEVTDVGRRERR